MWIELQILIVASIGFLWLTCAFEAFSSLSGGRVRRIELEDPKLAARLEKWLENEDAFRTLFKLLLFLLTALMSALAFAVLSSMVTNNFPPAWLALILAAAVLAAAVVGEIIARALLFRFDMAVLRFSMPVLNILAYTVFMPLISLARTASRKLGLKRGEDSKEGSPRTTAEDEILSVVESFNENGSSDLEESEKRMIRGIFDLDDMSVREIMTPRVDLFALPMSASISEAKSLFVSSGHSRIPVYGRSIDEIKGILFAKDFIDEEKLKGKTLDQLAHKPIFIPETKAVGELLDEIKRTRNHFAVIIDEYGGTSGVVTFEDIIEEIVGEVHDEYDTDEDVKSRPQLMPDGSVVLDARTLIGDVNDIMESSIPSDVEADTIGGFACAHLGRIPEEGEAFKIPGGLVCAVMKADKRKILQLKLTLSEDED